MFVLLDQHNSAREFTPLYSGVTVEANLPSDMQTCPLFEAVGAQLAGAGARLRAQLAKQTNTVRGIMFLGDSLATMSDDIRHSISAVVTSSWTDTEPISMATVKAFMCGLLRGRSPALFKFWRRLPTLGSAWKQQKGLLMCLTMLLEFFKCGNEEHFRLTIRPSQLVENQLGLHLTVFPASPTAIAHLPANTFLCVGWPCTSTFQATEVMETAVRTTGRVKRKQTSVGSSPSRKRVKHTTRGAPRTNQRRGIYGTAYYLNSAKDTTVLENCACCYMDVRIDGRDVEKHRIFPIHLTQDVRGSARGEVVEVELLWNYDYAT